MIYIHIPFCHRKCTYCAFYSLGAQQGDIQHRYVDALLREMHARRHEQAYPIRTVYLGGGTPSLLPVDELRRVAEGLRSCFDLSRLEEATIECNPEDLTDGYLGALADLGLFNRISIGIQSLDDGTLRRLGRRHTAQQALDSVRRAHAAGFGNISIDLMFGLGTIGTATTETTLAALAAVLPLVSHVSAYALTVEEGTALDVQVRQRRVALPDDDEVARQYHELHTWLQANGLHQYEVSNYARPGRESRHNSRYWDRTPYLGLGAAAHSFDGSRRRWNASDVRAYIECQPCEEEQLGEADAINELLMTRLRTAKGLSLAELPEPLRAELARKMQPYVDCGWLEATLPDAAPVPHPTAPAPPTYHPTPEGLLHADGMAAALFV